MNYWLFLLSVLRLKRVALWGLGQCKEEGQSKSFIWLRDKSLRAVNWYFAYTQECPYLNQHGVPTERTTVVQNATDTTELRRLLADITDEEAIEAKRDHTGNPNASIGFYCGAIGRIKDIPFLLESANRVKQHCPDFISYSWEAARNVPGWSRQLRVNYLDPLRWLEVWPRGCSLLQNGERVSAWRRRRSCRSG